MEIKGARTHNLKNINVKIPKNKLVVITGVSGSGKSSLAFDTLYAEGQRRYVESLSAYARQFLEQLQKPDVDSITNLSPAIAIEEKGTLTNPRSIVATTTEIADFLRVLFARVGIPHCPNCGRVIKGQSIDEIVSDVLDNFSDKTIKILAPLVKGKKGTFEELFLRLRKQGFVKVFIDENLYNLDEDIKLNKNKKHTISVVVDELEVEKSRLTESLNAALKLADGICEVRAEDIQKIYSIHHACPVCKISIGEISPRTFSFNSPYGACPKCSGLGTVLRVAEDLIINENLSIEEGAVLPWIDPITTRTHRWKGAARGYYYGKLEEACEKLKIPTDVKWKNLPKKYKDFILYGTTELYDYGSPFIGVIKQIEDRFYKTDSEFVKEEIMKRYMRREICPVCKGKRLKKESLAVKIKGLSIADICDFSVLRALEFFERIEFKGADKKIAQPLLKEIISRLKFIESVGLDYLTLSRPISTLSRGEAQRIRLATQIGSNLSGIIYVLDEPTIGLHQRDIHRLLSNLIQLKNYGNTVCVVEHEATIIRSADHIIDLGPGAGEKGGMVVFTGTPQEVLKSRKSLLRKYLSQAPIQRKKIRRRPLGFIKVVGASQYNLKNIDVEFPLGVFVCVTGVSGSGKSTLVEEILIKGLKKKLYNSSEIPGRHRDIIGTDRIDKVLAIDQTPIGRTPRSNPATYTKVWDEIRAVFASMPLARARGYKPGQFSFNVKSGRCEACKGDGVKKVEMHFLPDIFVTCDVCGGKRYTQETLEVTYKGKNIFDVLEMSVDEAFEFFSAHKKIQQKLKVLKDVGLGYIKLGQSATTLSGGEAQRVKLSRELSRPPTGRTLYFLDEPTTGLHFADIEKLLKVLHRLVDRGNTVIVIEHNMEIIKTADWIIDLGPEGGEKGGEVVACGTPEEIAKNRNSHTGFFLRKELKVE
ncbi:MAG: excinuclease ABC subunit UvrA [Elusimicrobia bacterium]|nr:excinuclease ABC subunit UvrA [Elusimicrobiota bacterium]